LIKLDEFTLVHATLNRPESWGYIMNTGDAAASFRNQEDPLCFHGHTHIPVIYDAGEFEITSNRKLAKLLPGHRYLCNVGSVGKPREPDQRATYAIYDDEARTVTIRRVDYDIEVARRKSRAAGLIK